VAKREILAKRGASLGEKTGASLGVEHVRNWHTLAHTPQKHHRNTVNKGHTFGYMTRGKGEKLFDYSAQAPIPWDFFILGRPALVFS